MTQLSIFLFGPPRIKVDQTSVKLSRHKAMALLVYLAITPEPQSRNTLATLLWPNQDQTRARAALRRVLMTLKNAGLSPWLEISRETIWLRESDKVWVDVSQFRQQIGGCLTAKDDPNNACLPLLTQALTLYRSDFLNGFTLRDSPTFDEWQYFQTENLRHDLSRLIARLVRIHSRTKEFDVAIKYGRRWLEMDPLYEEAHRELMQLYAWTGQRDVALRQYQECVRLLADELDVSPSEETTILYEKIQHEDLAHQDSHSFAASDAAKPSHSPFHNFPSQPTPFLGRQTELSEIAARLQNPDCHLASLIGPGGIGKTRLAIQASLAQRENFSDGRYFIPLASLSSSDFILPTIIDILNLTLDGREDPLAQLLHYLGNKQLLLVVDNFEHLINKVGLLAEILRHAPKVKILATSRERLNLQGEWAVEVKGMRYPTDSNLNEIEEYSAVALFLHHAYRIRSDFVLTAEDKVHIAKICQQMEGIPLGIELAASWVRVLSCREIAYEIERMYQNQTSFEFLTTTLHDVPQRHQNLYAVFEHSWQLLSAEEQRVLSQLAIFQGNYQREAIEGVTKASLPLITALVDKSLLTRSPANRYEMHHLLRQFATEKLHQSTVLTKQARDRHCEYFMTYLKRRQDHLPGANQKKILIEIGKEIENIRVGWRWAIGQDKVGLIAQAQESLWFFYAMYSWFQEGIETFARLIPLLKNQEATAENAILQGRILAGLGWFFMRLGFYDYAREILEQSITIFEEVDEQAHIATPLHYLGILAREMGDVAEARPYLQQALAIYRQTNNNLGMAWVLSNLGYRSEKLSDTDYETSRSLLQESLAIYKMIGNKQGISMTLNNLGYITYRHGDFTKAQQLLEESLALRREVGYPRGIAVALNNLGHVASKLEAYTLSKTYYFEALKIAENIQTQPIVLAALGGLALPYFYEGLQSRALALINLAWQHPASNSETKDRAGEALAKIKAELPATQHDSLHPSASQPSLPLDHLYTELVKEILAEED